MDGFLRYSPSRLRDFEKGLLHDVRVVHPAREPPAQSQVHHSFEPLAMLREDRMKCLLISPGGAVEQFAFLVTPVGRGLGHRPRRNSGAVTVQCRNTCRRNRLPHRGREWP